MRLLIVNYARQVYGAHATTTLLNDYVDARLGSYGPGVEAVEITLLYPPRAWPAAAVYPTDAEFRRLAERSPRVTFFRARRRIDVRAVCRGVSARSIAGDGHLTADELTRVAAAMGDALGLIRPRVKPAGEAGRPVRL